ncbi:hypothetical protein V8C44DRAFT_327888 [Trichoderma aethiopicum]
MDSDLSDSMGSYTENRPLQLITRRSVSLSSCILTGNEMYGLPVLSKSFHPGSRSPSLFLRFVSRLEIHPASQPQPQLQLPLRSPSFQFTHQTVRFTMEPSQRAHSLTFTVAVHRPPQTGHPPRKQLTQLGPVGRHSTAAVCRQGVSKLRQRFGFSLKSKLKSQPPRTGRPIG